MLPLYPESVRGVHPVCTDVRKLLAARAEGYRTIDMRVAAPLGLLLLQEGGPCAAGAA